MTGKVVSLTGSPLPQPETSERLIEWLEEALCRAKAGEIIGTACALLHRDRAASFHVVGFTGGFSMLGALDCAHTALTKVAMDAQG